MVIKYFCELYNLVLAFRKCNDFILSLSKFTTKGVKNFIKSSPFVQLIKCKNTNLNIKVLIILLMRLCAEFCLNTWGFHFIILEDGDFQIFYGYICFFLLYIMLFSPKDYNF